VQGALTSAVRHSGAAVVTVEVRCLPGEVRLPLEGGGAGGVANREESA
jgi:signal transduction histidine kinase